MALCCKKKARPYVDLVVAYGWGVFQCVGSPRLDWELLVGLYLNIERAELRYAMRTLHGVSQCFAETPDKSMFEASVEDPKLGEYLYQRHKTMAELDKQASAESNGGMF